MALAERERGDGTSIKYAGLDDVHDVSGGGNLHMAILDACKGSDGDAAFVKTQPGRLRASICVHLPDRVAYARPRRAPGCKIACMPREGEGLDPFTGAFSIKWMWVPIAT